MKKLFIILSAFFLAFSCASADCPKTEVVEKKQKELVKIIGEQNEKTRQVDELFKMVDRPDSPGAAIGIIKDGKLIYARGYGMANLDHHIPITPKTKFEIASTSKQFTAACIALLYQQGKLDLDDDIRKYLTDLPQFDNVITIKHLIYHTSGTGDYLGVLNLNNQKLFTDSKKAYEIIKKNRKLFSKPGDEFFYNNTGYFLLGKIVEKISGKSLRSFTDENIFQPLEMSDTFFRDDIGEPIKNIITPYYFDNKKKAFRKFIYTINVVGETGLVTTIGDFVKWEQNFYNRKIGKKGFHDLMMQKGRLNSGKETFYSFGLMHLDYKGLKTVMHNGSWPKGQNSIFMTFPDQKFSVVIFSNLAATRSLRIANAHKIADIYLADQLKKEEYSKVDEVVDKTEEKKFKLAEEQLEKYTGFYEYTNNQKIRKVFLKDGSLIYSAGTTNEKKLVALSENTFKFAFTDCCEITFKKNETDDKIQLIFTETDVEVNKAIEYEADRIRSLHSENKDLSKYEGTYYNEAMDICLKFHIKDGKLSGLLKNSWDGQWLPYEHAGKDIFVLNPFFGAKVQFKKSENDTVPGIKFSMWGAVKDLFLKKLD